MAKKLLTIFLAILMAFSCVACGGGPAVNDGDINSYETYDYTTGIDTEGQKYAIVENGVAQYNILYAADTTDSVLIAINDFNEYIQKVTGTRLVPVKEDVSTPEKYISIGNTQVAADAGINADEVENDGYLIKTDASGNVYIVAQLDRGLEYGLLTFLERFCGIRWINVGVEHVPTSENIYVQPCEILDNPQFAWREYMNGNIYNKELNKRFRYYKGDGEWSTEVSSTHNTTGSSSQPLIGWVNKADADPLNEGSTLGASYPEFFTDKTNSNKGYDICPSNGIFYVEGADARDVDDDDSYSSGFESALPYDNTTGVQENGEVSVASMMLAKMKRSIIKDTNQNINYIFVGKIDDRGAYCKCDVCNTRREEIKESGMWVILLNAISNYLNAWMQAPVEDGGLGQTGRTVTLATFAYQTTLQPPVKKDADGNTVPINDEVVGTDSFAIRIAPIELNPTYSFADPRQTTTITEPMEGWDACADHFMFWDYVANYVEYFWYFPTNHFLKDNMVYCQDLGVFYCMLQSSYTQAGIWFDEMRSYICSKLFWNFGWDVNYLMNEYLTLYYGEAADIVRSVIDQFENFYNQKRMEGTLAVRIFEPKGCFLNNDENQNPKEWITGILRTVEDGITLIENDTTLDANTKGDLVYKLEGVLITPMRMILRNYNSYYVEGKTDFAIKFFDLVEGRGIKYLGETSIRSVATRKAECGL